MSKKMVIKRKLHMGRVRDFFILHRGIFGMPLVFMGMLLLMVVYVTPLRDHNLLFLPVLLIALGIVGYVYGVKHGGEY